MTTKDKYINPYTDFGFKKLFGSDINKDLLIDFLNELIKEQGKIVNIQYLKNEQLGRSDWERKSIFDIYCENERGEKFIVEMQRAKQKYFKDRSIYYSTFPIQQQAKHDDWNYELKAIYFIGILDFVFDESKNNESYFHREVKLIDTKSNEIFYDKLTYIYLEMPKFNKSESELTTHFDKWLYVLKNLSKLERRPEKLQERVFERLFRVAEIARFTPTEMDAYENSLKIYRDLKNSMDTSKEEGLAEGLVKGEAIGLEKGEVIGLEKGEAIGRVEERFEIVRNSLQAGLSVEIISQITGLSLEEIESLK
jgi:predicted transposase/invertase (TIGR01784 family)